MKNTVTLLWLCLAIVSASLDKQLFSRFRIAHARDTRTGINMSKIRVSGSGILSQSREKKRRLGSSFSRKGRNGVSEDAKADVRAKKNKKQKERKGRQSGKKGTRGKSTVYDQAGWNDEETGNSKKGGGHDKTPPPSSNVEDEDAMVVAQETDAPPALAPATTEPTTPPLPITVTATPISLSLATPAPVNPAPVTPLPTTPAPSQEPTTASMTPEPSTAVPQTATPTTLPPETPAPTILPPQAAEPITLTPLPTTSAPSQEPMASPMTPEPTTVAPQTVAPTTLPPETPTPTILRPHTVAPTTSTPQMAATTTLPPQMPTPTALPFQMPEPTTPAPVTQEHTTLSPETPTPIISALLLPDPPSMAPASPIPVPKPPILQLPASDISGTKPPSSIREQSPNGNGQAIVQAGAGDTSNSTESAIVCFVAAEEETVTLPIRFRYAVAINCDDEDSLSSFVPAIEKVLLDSVRNAGICSQRRLESLVSPIVTDLQEIRRLADSVVNISSLPQDEPLLEVCEPGVTEISGHMSVTFVGEIDATQLQCQVISILQHFLYQMGGVMFISSDPSCSDEDINESQAPVAFSTPLPSSTPASTPVTVAPSPVISMEPSSHPSVVSVEPSSHPSVISMEPSYHIKPSSHPSVVSMEPSSHPSVVSMEPSFHMESSSHPSVVSMEPSSHPSVNSMEHSFHPSVSLKPSECIGDGCLSGGNSLVCFETEGGNTMTLLVYFAYAVYIDFEDKTTLRMFLDSIEKDILEGVGDAGICSRRRAQSLLSSSSPFPKLQVHEIRHLESEVLNVSSAPIDKAVGDCGPGCTEIDGRMTVVAVASSDETGIRCELIGIIKTVFSSINAEFLSSEGDCGSVQTEAPNFDQENQAKSGSRFPVGATVSFVAAGVSFVLLLLCMAKRREDEYYESCNNSKEDEDNYTINIAPTDSLSATHCASFDSVKPKSPIVFVPVSEPTPDDEDRRDSSADKTKSIDGSYCIDIAPTTSISAMHSRSFDTSLSPTFFSPMSEPLDDEEILREASIMSYALRNSVPSASPRGIPKNVYSIKRHAANTTSPQGGEDSIIAFSPVRFPSPGKNVIASQPDISSSPLMAATNTEKQVSSNCKPSFEQVMSPAINTSGIEKQKINSDICSPSLSSKDSRSVGRTPATLMYTIEEGRSISKIYSPSLLPEYPPSKDEDPPLQEHRK